MIAFVLITFVSKNNISCYHATKSGKIPSEADPLMKDLATRK